MSAHTLALQSHYVCHHDSRAGEKYGIYTLLDMHQDVFSGKFCGEGVPDWAVETGSKRMSSDVAMYISLSQS